MSRVSRPKRRMFTALASGILLALSTGLTAEQNVFKRMVGADANVILSDASLACALSEALARLTAAALTSSRAR